MIEQYLGKIRQGEHPPFELKIPVSSEDSNEVILRGASDTVRILQGIGIDPVLVGSASVLLQTNRAFEGGLHDLDFIIGEDQVVGVRDVLVGNDFAFWDEDILHANVRNLTGGFGRHHNFGASSESYLQDSGLPVWMGFFANPGNASFHENYAFSRFKLNLAIEATLLPARDIRTPVKERLIALSVDSELDLNKFLEIINLLNDEGIDFWNIIDEPGINDRDIERRKKLKAGDAEDFIEVSREEKYPLSIDRYLRPKVIRVFDTDIKVVDLSTSYWRVKRYFPHYLGPRDKYRRTARYIEASGLLPEDADTRRRIYEERRVIRDPVGVFKFERDISLDQEALSRSNGTLGDNNPNYWAVLLEGVHYVKK